MGGLSLGLIGGFIAGCAMALGALSILLNKKTNIAVAVNSDEEKSIEGKFEFFLAFLFAATAISFIKHPQPHYVAWSLMAAFFAGTVCFLFTHSFMNQAFSDNFALPKKGEKSAIFILIMIFLKNIPEGLAAGAIMNIDHSGLSYSLMSIIGLHALFVGVVCAYSFLTLGLDPALSFVGVLFLALVESVAGAVGGFLSQEMLSLLPLIIAFAGGALLSVKLRSVLLSKHIKHNKIFRNPSLVSGMIVMLIFIIWKELL
jgi:zinc transporter ZupT